MEIPDNGQNQDKTSIKSNSAKMKILAFHGYRQNANSFKAKIGSFRKAVAKYAELTFLSGPHMVKPEPGEVVEEGEDPRGWWFNAEDHSFSGKRVGGPAIGFTETLDLIATTFKEHGPFDGIMGFSQGACLVGILAAMQEKGFLPYKFHFAILASGFCSGSLVHRGFYDEEIVLPTLHVYGKTDKIIPKEMSDDLVHYFAKPIVLEHSGGHYVACSGYFKDSYRDFLIAMKDEHLHRDESDNNSNQSANPSIITK